MTERSSPTKLLEVLRSSLENIPMAAPFGTVRSITGLCIRATVPNARIGDIACINRPHERGGPLLCEVTGFASHIDSVLGEVILMPLGQLSGCGANDTVTLEVGRASLHVSEGWLGRIVDGLGRPLDGRGPLPIGKPVPIDRSPPLALERKPINQVFPTKIRVIDALITLGKGQRIGLFSGSGVGKSTLLGALARNASVDAVVVALVGERGREVGEFLDQSLGIEGQKKSVVVVATSDASALERLRAAQVATTIAESFRDNGQSVLLLVDSITRCARAQREIGLAAGEPPTRRGYPPSVFAMLPRLLERAGNNAQGSITAIYSVLTEGSDLDDPITDEVRSIVDGHIVLDRNVATRGRFPAVDTIQSLSRVMHQLVHPAHGHAARKIRQLFGAYEAKRDLVAIGAYQKGTDRELDEAIGKMPNLERFLRQEPNEMASFEMTIAELQRLSK